jgi:hypothetical protein
MKKYVLIGGLFIFLLPIFSFAEINDVSDIDGNVWRTWEISRRYNFISGFILGTLYVVDKNISLDETFDKDKSWKAYLAYVGFENDSEGNWKEINKVLFSKDEATQILKYERQERTVSLLRYQIVGITNSQIVDGLNLFYSDFRNRQIKISEAIYVIRKQVQGASAEEIEAISEWLRTLGRDYMKLQYKDKSGKLKFATFP